MLRMRCYAAEQVAGPDPWNSAERLLTYSRQSDGSLIQLLHCTSVARRSPRLPHHVMQRGVPAMDIFIAEVFRSLVRFPIIELHPVNRVQEIRIAYRKLKILQGFLFVPMTQNHIRYHWMHATETEHRVRFPAMPEIMDGKAR
ncbi:MAG: hypothetical protein V1897_06860 [Pseudomonadota bacterium]